MGTFIFFMIMLIIILNKNAKNKQRQLAHTQQQRQPAHTQQQRQQQRQQPMYTQQRQQPIFIQPVQKEEEPYDILKRAADNVREIQEEEDAPVVIREPAVTSTASQQLKQESASSGDLMKQVEELIVTGYSGNLSFQRDFIAEGMDILTRYEIR